MVKSDRLEPGDQPIRFIFHLLHLAIELRWARPLFGDAIRQIRVYNGSHAHDMRPYLTETMTGAAILAGMNAR